MSPTTDQRSGAARNGASASLHAPVTVIGGATGTGKSALALDLADQLQQQGWHPHILNADALQRYRGMDIGTAKVPMSERRGHPHHEIDVLAVTEPASVALFQQTARNAMLSIDAADPLSRWIIVGGTGLYINAVVRQLEFPGTDPAIRRRYETLLSTEGSGALHALLRKRDPAAAQAIDPRNTRRVVRALEVGEITGRPFQVLASNVLPTWCEHTMLVLEAERSIRAQRLAARTHKMWQDGLLDEVHKLIDAGLREGTTAKAAIGYAEALSVLDGAMTQSDAIERMTTATVRYAKRQDTWFRRVRDAHVIDVTHSSPLVTALEVLRVADPNMWGCAPDPGAQ